MRSISLTIILMALACAKAPSTFSVSAPSAPETSRAARLIASSPSNFTRVCDEVLADCKVKLKDYNHPRLLHLYDDAITLISNMMRRVQLAREVHPNPAMKKAAEACEQRLETYSIALAQDRDLYDALSQIDTRAFDEITRFWLFKTLREFRRAGVDRNAATRAKIKALKEELVQIGQEFGRNIRNDVRTIYATPDELEGLPKDWLAAHIPDEKGKIAITTDAPDYMPVMLYAKSGRVREQLWRAFRQRAYPQNKTVLKRLLERRYELATLLGYDSWAAYVTEIMMAETPQKAAAFITKGERATRTRAESDMAIILAQKKQDVPSATQVAPWEHRFYVDRIKVEKFGFDSQAMRPYFEYSRVKQGVMDITSQMFGIRYAQINDAVVWHPSVETYDIYEGDILLGRIHLDMHPREGKYKHAGEFPMTVGRLRRGLPEAALVCNFPKAGELMQHSAVETLFHEFGHLLHEIFAGHQSWSGISGINTEADFVEVPSMLLQEWALSAEVLMSFARHHETGAAIPATLVKKMKATREFGIGMDTRRQFFLASVSLSFYDRKPVFDLGQLIKTEQERFLPFRREWIDEDTHFELSFGHLDGYSANYYTYQWSNVIAKDLLTRFRSGGMLDSTIAMQYRTRILDPGGSKAANALVEAFLGRPYTFEAFQAWLDGNEK